MENLKRVPADDVQRVARKYLHPDMPVIPAVGDADARRQGGYDEAPELQFDASRNVKRRARRDSDSLERQRVQRRCADGFRTVGMPDR